MNRSIRIGNSARGTAVLALSFTLFGCLASTESVRLQDGRRAIRVECNYDASNCERKAREVCNGDFLTVQRGSESCENCGWEVAETVGEGNNVYKGVLYVQCKD
jgi:hypothetical protein